MKRAWYLGIVPLLLIVPLTQGHSGPAQRSGLAASGLNDSIIVSLVPYAGPTPDEALDASDQALRVAQEAAEAENARLAQEAAERAQSAAQRPSAPRSPVTGPIVVDTARWLRIHRCEQGDQWYVGGFGNDGNGLYFEGGLGMSVGAWQMAVSFAAERGTVLPASANSATPDEQMAGAQAFFDVYGDRPWGCKA